MTGRLFAFVAVLLLPRLASAAVYHVDGDEPCPGAGTAQEPWCSLDDAFAADVISYGDTIALYETEVPYPSQTWELAPEGIAAAPIILEPAPGHAPIFAGYLELDGKQYWTLRGLTVDRRDQSGSAIVVRSRTVSSRGVRIVGNAVWAANGRAIRIGLNTEPTIFDAEVIGNHILTARTVGIEAFETVGLRVLDNTVEGVICSTGDFRQQEGITVIFNNVGAEIAGNVVRNFPTCPDPVDDTMQNALHAVGIRVRTSMSGEIHHNFVDVVAEPMTRFNGGISIHEGSSDFVVHHNVVRGANNCGLCDGADFDPPAANNTWAHNTAYDVDVGIAFGDTTGAVTFGNVLVAREYAAEIDAGAGIASASANAYWTEGTEPFLVSTGPTDLVGWENECGCDADALVEDPGFLMLDGVTPAPGSVLLDAAAGSSWVEMFAGQAPDIGAFEPPLVLEGSAGVSDDGLTVQVNVDAGGTPPLVGVEGCAGLEVRRDEGVVALLSCTATHDEAAGISTLAMVLANPLFRGDVAEVAHLGTVTDASRVGWLSARLAEFALALDTSDLGERPDDPTDSGSSDTGATPPATSTSTSTGTGGGSTTSGTGPGAADPQGCGCGQDRGTGSFALVWLLALGLTRRKSVG